MAVIYIPVEIPDDEVAMLAGRANLAAALGAQPEPSSFEGHVRQPSEFGYQVVPEQPVPTQPDPWQASPVTPASYPAGAPTPVSTPQGGVAPTTGQAGPVCAHGPMRFVPAGFSKSTGKPYAAFYGCPAPRGQQQCKSVKAAQ